jgi:hypothetical protein
MEHPNMAEVLLVNPRRRRRKSASAKKRRRNPAKRRAIGYTVGTRRIRRRKLNPARRTRAKSYRRRVMRRRSNPIGVRGIVADLMPAVKGAVGAIATETAFRFLPTPGPLAMLKGGLAPVTKIGVAYGLSKVIQMFAGRSIARDMLSGALVVIAYDFVNQQVLSRIPMVSAGAGEYMSGLGYHSAGAVMAATPQLAGTGEYMEAYMGEGVGEYLNM